MNNSHAQIGIDVGYGYTKAVSMSGKHVCFPSVVAPPRHDVFGGFLENGQKHMIKIDYGKGTYTRLVGEAARESSRGITALTRHKPEDMHDYLLFAAAYMLDAGVNTDLAIGLPLAYYATQKDYITKRLTDIKAWVSVDSQPERRINFNKVVAIPQGLGAVFAHLKALPQQGLVGVIDIGTQTTDYLLLEISPESVVPRPLVDYCGSIENGVRTAQHTLTLEYNRITGGILSQEMSFRLTSGRSDGFVMFENKRIDMSDALEIALSDTTQTILHKVKLAWGDYATKLNAVVLCGGGSELFAKYLLPLLPRAIQVPSPIFANATGYLSVFKGSEKNGSTENTSSNDRVAG
jgi:plasmid segregation protein ParM